jgi:hypothetical protein
LHKAGSPAHNYKLVIGCVICFCLWAFVLAARIKAPRQKLGTQPRNSLGIYMSAQDSCVEVLPSHYKTHCYTYYHIFNNLVHDVRAYENGGNYIYSDTSSGKNTFENNLLIGATDKGSFIKHHCGLENLSKNNIIHR